MPPRPCPVAVQLLLVKRPRSRGLHASGMKRLGSRLRPLTFCRLFQVRRPISIPSLRLFWLTLRADTPRARPHAQPFLVLIIVVVMMVIIAVMMMMVVIVPMVMMMITPPAMVMMVVVVLSELRPAVRARIGSSCILALE